MIIVRALLLCALTAWPLAAQPRTVVLSWTAPTTYIDGTPVAPGAIYEYRLYTSMTAGAHTIGTPPWIEVRAPALSQTVATEVGAFWVVTAVVAGFGGESAASNEIRVAAIPITSGTPTVPPTLSIPVWHQAWTGSTPATAAWVSVALEPVRTAALRLDGFGNSLNAWNSLREIRLLTPEGVAIPIRQAWATADDGHTADRAIDGKLDTRWSASGRTGVALYLVLLDTMTIGTVELLWYNGASRAAAFALWTLASP